MIGSSNAEATEPKDQPVNPGDMAATIFSKLGIDPKRKLIAPGDRPLDIVREGEAIKQLV